MSIPVICDRCRVAGTAGTGDFSHLGDLLEFDPVPRPRKRVDGWSEEKQRAFIALLATTGNQRRASMALGMAPYGASKLREAPGSDSFNAAWERAMEIAKQNGSMKISTAVADAAARNAYMDPPPSRLRGQAPSPPSAGEGWDEEEPSDDKKLDLFESLFGKYLLKLQAERTARLAGKVVEADFILRQVTFFEVALDLGGQHQDVDVLEWMKSLRRGAHGLIDIARTPMSRFLDEARRMLWSGEFEEPDRPEPTNGDLFDEYTGYSLEPLEYVQDGPDVNFEQKRRELEERWRKAAVEQVEWERTQRREQDD